MPTPAGEAAAVPAGSTGHGRPGPRSPLAPRAHRSPGPCSPPVFKAGLKRDPPPPDNIKRVLVLCVSLGAPFEKLFDLQIMSNKLSKGMLLSK